MLISSAARGFQIHGHVPGFGPGLVELLIARILRAAAPESGLACGEKGPPPLADSSRGGHSPP